MGKGCAMSHINERTVTDAKINSGRPTNIPDKGNKGLKFALRVEVDRLEAGGRPRDFHASIEAAVKASKARSAASQRKGTEAEQKRTRQGKKRFR